MTTLPIVVLDRDGIINEDSPHYIKSVDEFIMLPGSAEAIAQLHVAGYRVGVATNQSGIARGLYDTKTLTAIHAKMQEQVRAAGGEIEEIVYCPHLPEEACSCRKPKPGLLLELAERFECVPEDMIFIGDKLTDIQAAEAVGARAMLILSSMTDKQTTQMYPDVPTYHSLKDCVIDFLSEREASA